MGHTEPFPKPTHWAVLIGVGITIDNQAGTNGQTLTRDSSLEGAVADIDMIESYFNDDVCVKINKLTATKSPDKPQSNLPLEPLERLPTGANVTSALKAVIREGADGHIKHVYIHFSGHGARAHDGTLALSLYEPHPRGKSRLLTQHLATALNKMTEQGMHVTLVLDCCFSGSVKRTGDGPGPQSRFIQYEPEEEHLDLQNPFLEGDSGQVRQTSLNMGHLLEPNGYSVITACGPSENAWEVGVGNGKQHGLLSYFLHASLMHLKRSGENISFQTLYRHLQAKFHAYYPRQTPRHYGSMTNCFFQHITCDLGRYLVTAFRIPGEERLILKAGKVHGVHEGDTYEAYPYYASEANVELLRRDSVLLKVKAVESL